MHNSIRLDGKISYVGWTSISVGRDTVQLPGLVIGAIRDNFEDLANLNLKRIAIDCAFSVEKISVEFEGATIKYEKHEAGVEHVCATGEAIKALVEREPSWAEKVVERIITWPTR